MGGQGRWSALRRGPLVSCCAGARERRGPACTDVLPADSSTFPANVCTFGREVGGLRLPAGAVGGQGAGARCDVDRLLTSSHVLATGEDQLVLTSSRLILRLFRLTLHPCRDSGGLRRPGARREPE